MVQHLVALGTTELTAEVVGVLGRNVCTAEVVYHFFALNHRVATLWTALDVEKVGVQTFGTKVDAIDELRGTDIAFFQHGLNKCKQFAQGVPA